MKMSRLVLGSLASTPNTLTNAACAVELHQVHTFYFLANQANKQRPIHLNIWWLFTKFWSYFLQIANGRHRQGMYVLHHSIGVVAAYVGRSRGWKMFIPSAAKEMEWFGMLYSECLSSLRIEFWLAISSLRTNTSSYSLIFLSQSNHLGGWVVRLKHLILFL